VSKRLSKDPNHEISQKKAREVKQPIKSTFQANELVFVYFMHKLLNSCKQTLVTFKVDHN
jgi:hypothetical protein